MVNECYIFWKKLEKFWGIVEIWGNLRKFGRKFFWGIWEIFLWAENLGENSHKFLNFKQI